MSKNENSLGLSGDGDEVDVLEMMEDAFSFKIEQDDADTLMNVGDLHDLIKRKMPTNANSEKICYTAHTFYRLRKGLETLTDQTSFRPKSKIPVNVSGLSEADFKRHLQNLTGLKLPNLHGGIILNIALVFILFCWVPLLVDFFNPLEKFMAFLALLGWGIVLANQEDGSQLGEEYQTLGALAEKTAVLNYGQLSRTKNDVDKNGLWNAMETILRDSGEGYPPAEINRKTVFFESQLKN